MALLLAAVGGGQQDLVLRTGPEACEDVAVGVPVQQNLQQTDKRTPSSTSSSKRSEVKEDTHVLGVPSVRGGPDEPVQNHVLGRVLPGHPEAVCGHLAAPEVQRFWKVPCGQVRQRQQRGQDAETAGPVGGAALLARATTALHSSAPRGGHALPWAEGHSEAKASYWW